MLQTNSLDNFNVVRSFILSVRLMGVQFDIRKITITVIYYIKIIIVRVFVEYLNLLPTAIL